MSVSRAVILQRRPVGAPTADDFAMVSVELPPLADGEVEVRNRWMSVDPYMRGRMSDEKSYIAPFALGEILEGHAIGEVVASRSDKFAVGDIVTSMYGWRDRFIAPALQLRALDPKGLPLPAFLGAAGVVGLTAYVGLMKVAALKPGETVFVSAAAGAVGSAACQIAKLKGCRVIGTAGGAEKIAFLEELGIDAAVDYKNVPDLTAAVRAVAPDGIDVYFDNVGGTHLEAALACANDFARFAICGMISQYNVNDRPVVPANLFQIVVKSIKIEGYIISNHYGMMKQYLQEFRQWHADGHFQWRETVVEGIEHSIGAFLQLFDGRNIGKMLVKL